MHAGRNLTNFKTRERRPLLLQQLSTRALQDVPRWGLFSTPGTYPVEATDRVCCALMAAMKAGKEDINNAPLQLQADVLSLCIAELFEKLLLRTHHATAGTMVQMGRLHQR